MEHGIFLEGTRVSACWNVSHRGTVPPEITLSNCMRSTEITVISSLNIFSRLIPFYEIYMESTFVRFYSFHSRRWKYRRVGENVVSILRFFLSFFPSPLPRYVSVDKKECSLRGISIESKCTTTGRVNRSGLGRGEQKPLASAQLELC